MAGSVAKRSSAPPIDELDVVRLLEDVEAEGGTMPAGAEGTVVHIYRDGAAFEVEFLRPFHLVATISGTAVERASA